MSEQKTTVKRVLVKGDATFYITCNDLMAMVTPEQAADEKFMEEWLRTEAYRMLASGFSSGSDSEFSSEIAVEVSRETADLFTGKILAEDNWLDVLTENRRNKAK